MIFMNGIVFLISHSVSLVCKKTINFYEWDFIPNFSLSMSLVYKKTTDLCMVVLYPKHFAEGTFQVSSYSGRHKQTNEKQKAIRAKSTYRNCGVLCIMVNYF